MCVASGCCRCGDGGINCGGSATCGGGATCSGGGTTCNSGGPTSCAVPGEHTAAAPASHAAAAVAAGAAAGVVAWQAGLRTVSGGTRTSSVGEKATMTQRTRSHNSERFYCSKTTLVLQFTRTHAHTQNGEIFFGFLCEHSSPSELQISRM